MSQEITQASSLIKNQTLYNLPKPATEEKNVTAPQTFTESSQSSQSLDFLRTAMHKLSGGREYSDEKSFKAFNKLSGTLEQFFSKAERLGREEGHHEMRGGGMRRIDTDLRKLFKGLGMPPQLAKHFSREITSALRSEDVEEVNFSLTSTRSFNLAMQQEQIGYLANGDSAVVAGVSNSFQLSAVQTHSVDVSINLRTGEFALNRSSSEAYSISTSSTAALASYTPSLPAGEGEPAEQLVQQASVETPEMSPVSSEEAAVASVADRIIPEVEPQNDITTLVQSDSTLLGISRTIEQSAIMQLIPVSGGGAEEDSSDELFADSLASLQELITQLEDITATAKDLFESLTEISNLRIENNPADGDDYLNFTLASQAPIGLTAVDGEGHGATIFPTSDGEIAKVVDEELNITA